ncbi:MAG: signal peptidase I [Desulfotomaculales bacterium]
MTGLEHGHDAAGPLPREDKGKKTVVEFVESVIIAVLLAVLIRTFILAPFYIPSGSMRPTLLEGDRIIVSKISYRIGAPQRGDIIVFKDPRDPRRDLVKRLIGLGGETVALKNNHLYINGQMMPENYLPQGTRFADYGPSRVPEGYYLMLGDNRNVSDDSRYWGPLPEKNIIGKALFIYWPLNRIRLLN